MEFSDIAAFTFSRERHKKIVFISAGATVCLVLRVFFVILDNPWPTLITQSVVFTCQTLLTHKYTDNVTDSVFFILWNIPFLLVSALDSKGIMNTPKRYYVAMECTDLVAFTFTTWETRLCLLCKWISPCQMRPSWICLLLRVSLVG